MNAIDEIRYDKAVLEREIDKLIDDFEKKYDVRIETISLEEIYMGNGNIFQRVTISVKI